MITATVDDILNHAFAVCTPRASLELIWMPEVRAVRTESEGFERLPEMT